MSHWSCLCRERYNYLDSIIVMTNLARAIGLEEPVIDAPMNGIP